MTNFQDQPNNAAKDIAIDIKKALLRISKELDSNYPSSCNLSQRAYDMIETKLIEIGHAVDDLIELYNKNARES